MQLLVVIVTTLYLRSCFVHNMLRCGVTIVTIVIVVSRALIFSMLCCDETLQLQ